MKTFFSLVLISFTLLIVAQVALADTPQELLEKNLAGTITGLTGEETSVGDIGKTGQELPQKVGAIMKVLIGVLGVVLTAYIVLGGYYWLTAGGDTEQVKKAKQHITNGIIGLIICVLAYAITSFVISKLVNV